jgi:hypothetical protein
VPHVIKTKWFRIAALVGLLVVLYALAGFLLVPHLLRNALLEDIPKSLPGITPAVGKVRFNPLRLQLEINDFSLADSSGEKLLGFNRLFVDFQVSSLWHRAYTFKNIELGAPFVNAVTAKDGQLNLLQLAPTSAAPTAKPKQDGSVPALRLGSFKVSDGLLSYDDRAHPSDFAARLQPINFELHDFTTGVDGGLFTFTGQSKLGERVEWHGHVSVQPIESDGEFQIDGLQAHTIWEYLEDRLNFLVNSGSIDLTATYNFALRDAVDLSVDVSKIAVSNLTVRARDADVDWVTLPQLLVSDTHVDLAKQTANVETLTLTGLKLITWLEPDGSINLMKLAAAPAPKDATPVTGTAPPPGGSSAPMPGAAAAATPAQPVPAAPASAAPAWAVSLHELALRDADISAEDRSTRPAASVHLAPLSISVADASLDLAKPVHVTLATKINDSGSLNVDGQITPKPVTADLSMKLSGIDLTLAQPYIAQRTSMTLKSGELSGATQLHYGPTKPAIDFSGNLSIAKLHTVDNALHDDFVNWDRFDVQGLRYQHDPDRLDIEQVTAQKAYARVIIEPDATLNVTRVLAGPGATVVAPGAPGSSEGPITATAKPPVASVPAAAAGKRKHAKPVGTVASAQPAGAAAAMPIVIKKIALEASEADFSDLSVQPNFTAGIQKLHGTVLGLSSKPNARAKIDLNGQVDPYAPVTISGEVNVLGPLYTDLTMGFHNIELSTFNPYSGKFAGYDIAKGKLTTDLHYKVDGRKLDAQHHIVVDQLEFGDKTESKQAVSLPIKLAVSLLKNRDGVIELDIPVNGSLDDPQFKLGPIIWKAFVNILEKAVTAPFALLGSLFGGGPDLQFIDFEPGAAELDANATAKAQTIVKALHERPQLKIDVPIAVVESIDRPSLIEAQFKAQVQDVQAALAAKKKSGSASVPFEQLDPATRLDILSQLYQKDFGSQPKFPDTVTSIKAKPDLLNAKIDFLSGELHAHVTVSATDLTNLGQQRAQNLQQILLKDSQIEPERVFLVANDKAKAEGDKVRLELSLK